MKITYTQEQFDKNAKDLKKYEGKIFFDLDNMKVTTKTTKTFECTPIKWNEKCEVQ